MFIGDVHCKLTRQFPNLDFHPIQPFRELTNYFCRQCFHGSPAGVSACCVALMARDVHIYNLERISVDGGSYLGRVVALCKDGPMLVDYSEDSEHGNICFTLC